MTNTTAIKDFAALAPIVHAAHAKAQEDEHSNELKEAQAVRGFVRAVPASKTAHNKMPTLVGLYVAGNQGCRVFYADKRAPEWFAKVLEEESIKSNPMQFRVRVGSISKNGSSAYVWPMAKDLAHAKKEWHNEQRKLDKEAKTVADCKTKEEVARLVYQEYARTHGGVVVKFNKLEDKNTERFSAYMVRAPYYQKTAVLLKGEDVWLFTDGIALGHTSLESEIKSNVEVVQL